MRHLTRAASALLLVGLMLSTGAIAQSARTLTLDAIYDPARRVDFSGAPSPEITWLDDNTYLTTRRGGRGAEWVKVDAASGRTSELFDAGQMTKALSSLPGVSSEQDRKRG